MSEQVRAPVIRKRKTAEEIAHLHPLERTAYRVFEFLSSIRLALFVLSWLIVECIVGATLESRVNTDAARYFVYGATHFYACLAFLSLNIFCAAAIRFPWKRYQTGFVITHIGLLLFMFGSFLTLRGNVDALLVASKFQGEDDNERWSNRAFNAHKEYLEVVELDPQTGEKRRQELIPLDLGPFTWGEKIFGVVPWGVGYEETHRLRNGDEIRIKNFYANCDREDAYVPAEKGLKGVDALRTTFALGDRQVFSEWLTATPAPKSQTVMGVGQILVWKAPSAEAYDHFVHAVPPAATREDDGGLYGWLTVVGKTRVKFRVDELKQGRPVKISGTEDAVEVLEYYADAKSGPTPGSLQAGGTDPNNPGLKIRYTTGGKAEEYYCLADRKGNELLRAVRKPPAAVSFVYRPVGTAAAGYLAVTAGGKHALLPLDELQSTPATVGDVEIELVKYLPDARVAPDGSGLESASDQPNNPAVMLNVKTPKSLTPDVTFCFADPKFDAVADTRRSIRATLLVERRAPSVEVCVAPEGGPDGSMAYRAWSRSGFSGAGKVELGKAVPVWPVPQFNDNLKFAVTEHIANARADGKLFPKPLEARENGERGAVVEFRSPDGKATVNLNRHTETIQGGMPVLLQWPNRVIRVRLAHEEFALPFSLRLEDFIQPNIPGSRKAAMYTSIVKVKDGDEALDGNFLITMNRPLRYTSKQELTAGGAASGFRRLLDPLAPQGFILYQTSIAQTESGPMSTYTVSRDPGILIKYAGVFVTVGGILLMFYMGGYFRGTGQPAVKKAKTTEGDDE